MKGRRGTVWLFMGLCFVNLASPLFSAQNQSAPAATGTVPDPFQMLDDLQKRLELAKAELASIREQMSGSLTTKFRQLLLERLQYLENELEPLKGELASIKQQQLRGSVTTTSSESGSCCIQKQDHKQTISCVGNPCPPSLSVVRRQQVKDLVITVEDEGGRLSGGRNSFCVRFADSRTNQAIEVGEVQLDVTLGIRHVKALRAVAQVSRSAKGLYCGHVSLGMRGEWELVVRYDGPAGRAKIPFVVTLGGRGALESWREDDFLPSARSSENRSWRLQNQCEEETKNEKNFAHDDASAGCLGTRVGSGANLDRSDQ